MWQFLESSGAKTSEKDFVGKLKPSRPNSGPSWGFPAFSSYFTKRGKNLLNWYFISVDYIEFLSLLTPLLPSSGIE